MKILAFSDLHNEEIALEGLEKIASNFDYVFVCGDTTQNQSFAERVLTISKNIFIIPGNLENKQMNEFLENIDSEYSSTKRYVHEQRVEIQDGLNVVGFGYSNITPFGTYGELNEQEIYEKMSKLDIDKNTLLMLHCPPKGYFDKTPNGLHVGSTSILKIIEEKKPLAVFFGHIHENKGMDRINNTTLVKLPAASNMRACEIKVSNKKIDATIIVL